MRLDRLTNKFQLALADAQSLALGHDNQFIEPLHLMSALLNQEGGSVRPLLTSAGINAGQLRTAIDQALRFKRRQNKQFRRNKVVPTFLRQLVAKVQHPHQILGPVP